MEFPWLFENDFVILQRQTIKQQFKKVEATPKQFSPKVMNTNSIVEILTNGNYNFAGMTKKEFINGVRTNFCVSYSVANNVAKKMGIL